jgi:putative ABC transport system permease protein
MVTALHDLRVAARSLRKSPGFTAVVVLTLALGIGATAAIFSVLNAVLLRPLPYPSSERIMTLWTNNGVQGWPEDVSGYPNFADWRANNTTFTEMAVYTGATQALTGAGEPEQLRGTTVFPTFFEVMGVSPARGRALTMEDFTADRRVVVLSDDLWRRRFAADPRIVGSTIQLGGAPYEVVGVMPAHFAFPSTRTQFWVSFGQSLTQDPRGNFWLSVVGRLKPGVTIDRARAEMTTIAARLEKEYPASNANLGVTIIPLHENTVGDVRRALLLLMGAVGFVLLIACANVANLLLARGAGRTREIAVRAALGAGRGRIVRQLLTESILLAFLGGALGLLLAKWGVDLLVALGPAALPRMNEVTVDGSMLAFTLGASLLTAMLFGLPPALRASSVELGETLKEGTRSMSAARGGARVRRTLVVSEIALALMLLIGAGLLFASFRRLSNVDAGFNGDGVVTARITLPRAKYPQPALVRAFYGELLERAKALPGVRSAGYTASLPLSSIVNGSNVLIEARPPMPDLDQKEVRGTIVSGEYFSTLGIQMLAGHTFTPQDRGDTVNVVVVNETMKKLHFLGEDPIGRRMRYGCVNDGCPWLTVIGVVRDAKQDALEQAVRPEVYMTYLQQPRLTLSIAIRTDGDPLAVVPSLRTTLQSLDRDIPLSSVATMEQLTADSVATRRFNTLLLGIFSSLALVLALVGIYGVMSYSVSQRRQEVGIRMALGAHAGQVLRLVLREAMVLAGIGIALGILLSLGVTRLLGTLLFEVSATDVTTFTITASLLAGVALLASYVPARRAAGVDPLVALRSE